MRKNNGYRPPRFGAAQIRLLERLCNACAVSGNEGAVREIVLEQVRPHVSEVKVDALGNVLAIRSEQGMNSAHAEQPRLRVMLAAHMDEVGFMITTDEGGQSSSEGGTSSGGFFRFDPVGGLVASQLVGKPVWVGRERLPGVIGAKPIHHTTNDERKQSVSMDALRIDVSPDNARKVKIGDWATFATSFTRLGPSLLAKALDDRLGVATLIEVLRQAPPHVDLLAAFTVQEEVGLRGARVAAYALNPDLAIVLDCTPARDMPPLDGEATRDSARSQNTRYNTRLGAGPAIYIADRDTLSDPRLIRHLVSVAEVLDIPYQFRQPGGGGTDAGAIHQQRAGIPSVSISVPGRYLHTAAGLVRLEDWKNTLALVHAALSRLTPAILQVER